MASIKDDKGYNQGFRLVESTKIRMQRRASMILNAMPITQQKKVLEIGAGTGELAFWIAQQSHANIISTDICVPFIESAKKKYQLPNLEYRVLDFNDDASILNEKFDYIIGNGILHHLFYNLNNALSQFKKLLNPGGKIIFMEPNIYNPYIACIFKIKPLRKIANLEPDEMAFSKTFISKKLMANGFKNIQIQYKDFLLPGIPIWMVKPSIAFGNVLEKIPFIKCVSQSLFIEASI